MIALLLALGQAHADADADLYPRFGVADCDDNDAQVNPAAIEWVGDGVDDDCDGHDALRRWFMVDKFASAGWTTTGNVVFAADTIELEGEMLGASASRNLTVQGNGHV